MRFPLHPVTILAFVIFSMIVGTAGMELHEVFCGVLLILSMIHPERRRIMGRIMRIVVPLAVVLLVVNYGLNTFFHQPNLGIPYALRFTVLTLPIILAAGSITPSGIASALHVLRVPLRLQYIVLLSFETASSYRDMLGKAAVAQQLRGFRIKRTLAGRAANVMPLLLPLALNSLMESVERGIMFDFKGIEAVSRKTALHERNLSGIDKILVGAFLLGSLAIIVS